MSMTMYVVCPSKYVEGGSDDVFIMADNARDAERYAQDQFKEEQFPLRVFAHKMGDDVIVE